MKLRDIKYHNCPEDDEEAVLLVDPETETEPVLDEDGNLMYYCRGGEHLMAVDADEAMNEAPLQRAR